METVSRLSSMLETTRDLTLEAVQSGRSLSVRSTVPKEVSFSSVKKLLDSRHDREILDGLRKVIGMMYQSKPCLPYFSSVVKNVASPNIEIKKLVYIFLLHHAESEPDLALLSINTIQRSLSDQNPHVRAMALRVMSGIRVPVISQIVCLAIKKGCGDMSPHVRKAAALAIPKCYRLDPGTLPQLLDYLSTLLGDRQYYVVGSAVTAFLEVCPHRIDLIHKHYKALVRKLVDMDDWGQLALIRLMTIYARKCFPRPASRSKNKPHAGFYEDEEAPTGQSDKTEEDILDPDLERFLKACLSLLQSRNSAVILAVTRCFIHIGTAKYIDMAIGPLIALLRSPSDLHEVILYNIVSICLIRPLPFIKYIKHFLIRASDSPVVWQLKIETLTLIFPHCDAQNKGLILTELEHFTRSNEPGLVKETVRAIGRCAQADASTSGRCMTLLMKQASSPDGTLAAESLTVIRHLIQKEPAAHAKTVIRLAKNLDKMTNPTARASIIWLVGEFAGADEDENIAPDVLRILVQNFSDEAQPAKLQILLLAAKVYVNYLNKNLPSESTEAKDELDHDSLEQTEPGSAANMEHPIETLWAYVLLLARYDTSYDLRDRARLYKALVADKGSVELANLMLLAPKPFPHAPSPSEGRKDISIGSASLVIGKDVGPDGVPGYEPLPDWVEESEAPDPSLRAEADSSTSEYVSSRSIPASDRLDAALKEKGVKLSSSAPNVSKEKSLDEWLAEEEASSESGSEEGSAEDESSEEEETDEQESTEEESESEGNEGEGTSLMARA